MNKFNKYNNAKNKQINWKVILKINYKDQSKKNYQKFKNIKIPYNNNSNKQNN